MNWATDSQPVWSPEWLMSSRRCHFSNRATRPRFNPPLSGVCAPLCQRLPLLTSVKYPVINTPTSGACFQNKTGYDSYFFFFFLFLFLLLLWLVIRPTNIVWYSSFIMTHTEPPKSFWNTLMGHTFWGQTTKPHSGAIKMLTKAPKIY